MRVCLVVPYDLAVEGGVKKHALCLAAALERTGDEVDVIGPASGPVDVRNATTFGGVVSIRSNGSDNRLARLTSPFKVRAYLQTRKFVSRVELPQHVRDCRDQAKRRDRLFNLRVCANEQGARPWRSPLRWLPIPGDLQCLAERSCYFILAAASSFLKSSVALLVSA